MVGQRAHEIGVRMAAGSLGFNHSKNDCELGSEVWPASDGNPVVCLLNSPDEGVGSQCLFFGTSVSMFFRISHSPASSWPCSPMRWGLTSGECSGSQMKWRSPKPHSCFLPRLPRPTRGFAFSLQPESYRWRGV